MLTRLKSRGRYKHLSLMKKYEYKPIIECRELQKDLLFNILKYAIKNVPYYRIIAENEDITISRNGVFEDIRKFPILTKQNLRNDFNDLKSETYKGKCYKDTSGGSTGEPVLFLQDLSYKEELKGSKIFFYEWAGREDGEKMIKLWGSVRDILQGSQGVEGWIAKNLLNVRFLNSFQMTEDDIKNFVEVINKERPIIIEAYIGSIYELAKFIKTNKLDVFSPKGVLTSAGTLYPEVRKLVEEVFNAKVYNRYGSREVGDMACSCEKDERLHLNIFNHHIEILNEALKPCKPGEIGQIYVTTLNNHVMPLIRYQIGDVAVPAKNEQCSCGRGLPLIEKVVGRTTERFKKRDGSMISGAFFFMILFYKDWINKFQIIQKDYDLIEYNIEKRGEPKSSDLDEIRKNVRIVMGVSCTVKFNFVDEIKPTKSGKHLYAVCEIKD